MSGMAAPFCASTERRQTRRLAVTQLDADTGELVCSARLSSVQWYQWTIKGDTESLSEAVFSISHGVMSSNSVSPVIVLRYHLEQNSTTNHANLKTKSEHTTMLPGIFTDYAQHADSGGSVDIQVADGDDFGGCESISDVHQDICAQVGNNPSGCFLGLGMCPSPSVSRAWFAMSGRVSLPTCVES